jgi:hypothetical protein
MTRTLIAACTLSLALTYVGNAQSTASSPATGAQFTQAEAKQMERVAHDPGQYKTLANYFGERQKSYMQKAADAKKEWELRGQGVIGNQAKYPRPVDSARNLYEYYMYQASKAGNLEAKYNHLASPDTTVNAE